MGHMSIPAYSPEEMAQRLPQLLEAVAQGERVVVRRADGEQVVLMSKADLESLELTLEILSDPGARDSLKRSRAEAAAGLAQPLEKHFPRPA